VFPNMQQFSRETIATFEAATKNEMAKRVTSPMGKAVDTTGVTTSLGLVWYDLQTPAKNVFPVLTPIRNTIPRVPGDGGTATHWISVHGVNTKHLRGAIPEGTRNARVVTSVIPHDAAYAAFGLEDAVSFEAEQAAMNFEPIRATTAQRLLWATMIEEEISDVGGNYDMTIAAPTNLSVTPGVGGSIAAAPGGYDVTVVALSHHGYLAADLTNGVPMNVPVTSADGSESWTYGGGNSVPATKVNSGAVSSSGSLSLSCDVMNGAVAYAWYVGAANGEMYLQAITTINSALLTAALVATGQKASDVTASGDASFDSYDYNGLLYQALTPASGAYIKTMATGVDGTGTPLTDATDDGQIPEILAMFTSMWNNYKLGPDKIYGNSQEIVNISKKILAANPTHVNFVTGTDATGGVVVKKILNPVSMGASTMVDLLIHPYMPPGTIIALTETLPYPMTNVPRVYEMRLNRDYYQIEWPLRTRRYESGVYFNGVLVHYFPPSMGVIRNIANG